ncbi:unnamed protein product [Phaeothamnion confervicola]
MRYLLFLTLFFLPMSAHAQSQTEMNQQTYLDYHKADDELNRVYKALLPRLDPKSKEMLITAQLAWIKFRDADAEARAAINIGGTIHPMILNLTMTASTQARTKELKEWMKELDSH